MASDPFGELLGKKVKITLKDDKVIVAMLYSLSYNYVSTRHPFYVINRQEVKILEPATV